MTDDRKLRHSALQQPGRPATPPMPRFARKIDALGFILEKGIAEPLLEVHFDGGATPMGFAASQMEKYEVIPRSGVSGEQLCAFFFARFEGKDLNLASTHYEAARAAEKAGLVEIREAGTKEFPIVKITP